MDGLQYPDLDKPEFQISNFKVQILTSIRQISLKNAKILGVGIRKLLF